MKLHSLKNCGAAIALTMAALIAAPLASAAVKIEHWVAPTGTRVFFVETRTLPIIDVQVDFSAGAARDPAGKSGLAQLTRGLMDLGAADMDESAIAEKLADLGARLGGGADTDRASVSLRTLADAETRTSAFSIMRSVMTKPRFPKAVFERERTRTLAALRDSLTRPEVLASKAFWSALYGEHPYGLQPDEASLSAITLDDMKTFHARHYVAQGSAVTIVGALNRSEAEALAVFLTEALPKGEPLPALASPSLPKANEVRVAHHAAQAHIQIGQPALKRGDPDFYALQVGNYSLGGGGFVSRLMKEVRDKRGFAYSVYSYFAPMQEAGPFQIGLQTKREQTAEALRVTREVLQKFLAEGPSKEELSAAKANLIGGFPLRLDNNRKILDNVAAIGFFGLPLDYLDTYADNVRKVTAADVRAAFARHISPENLMTVVVAGD